MREQHGMEERYGKDDSLLYLRGNAVVQMGATPKAMAPICSDGQLLGVEQFEGFLVDLHILPE